MEGWDWPTAGLEVAETLDLGVVITELGESRSVGMVDAPHDMRRTSKGNAATSCGRDFISVPLPHLV